MEYEAYDFISSSQGTLEFYVKVFSFSLSAALIIASVSVGLISPLPVAGQAEAAGASIPSLSMTPHRALYKMTLLRAERESGLIGAGGVMAYKFANSCDGWITESSVYLRFSYEEGEDIETTWAFTSWEAYDGLKYRYRMKQTRNGEEIEVLQGEAKKVKAAGQGKAVFSIPEGTEIDLPEGSLFPTRHLISILDKARSGEKRINRFVFDGASLDNPYEINAVFTNKTPSPPRAGAMINPKLTGQSPARQHIQMAFYPFASQESLPEFELSAEYRSNGIAEFIRQDFGNFILDLVPETIEELERPTC